MTTTLTIGTAVGTAGTGTITLTNASAAVTGVGTLFTTELRDGAGNPMFFEVSGIPYQVLSIASDTSLTLETAFGGTTASGLAFVRGGRNFSTVQGFASFLPATLADSYVGECYNDSEFTVSSGTVVTFSGNTTTATFDILLTTGPGQSFADSANAQTNALTYNQANGVGLNANVAYSQVIYTTDQYVTFSKLQIKEGVSGDSCIQIGAGNCAVSGCLIDHNGVSAGNGALLVDNSAVSSPIINTIIIERTSGMTTGAINGIDTVKFVNCTFVAPSDLATKPTVAINSNYGSATLENCAFFGFAALSTGTTVLTYTTCATDLASPPAGVTGSLTYASQFQGTTNAGSDFRLKSGANLIDAATTDTTDIPAANDIVGTTRPQGSAWDIGAWELKSAAAASAPVIFPLPF